MKITNIINGVEQALEGLKLENGKVNVEITEERLDIHIVFEYDQILGSITVKYVDKNTGEEIAEPTVMENLPLGVYEVAPKEIAGYKLAEEK